MKATVIFKFGGKTKLKVADGRIMVLNDQEAKSINPVMQYGDSGELYNLPNGRLKFRIDAVDGYLLPINLPAIIETPKEEDTERTAVK